MGGFFLISGNDEFAIKAGAGEHIAGLCGADFENNPALEVISGDSETTAPAVILANFTAALKTPPFLSGSKVVWLRHFNFFEMLADAAPQSPLYLAGEELTAFFKSPVPDDLTVVIDGPGLDQRKSLFKTFKQVDGAVIDFYRKADLRDRDYSKNQAERIAQAVRRLKKQIEPAAADFLITAVGSDSGRILNEVDKLAAYTGDERKLITIEDCRNICSRTPEALAWEFTDALTSGNAAAAVKAADNALETAKLARAGNNPELGLISQAVRAFEDVLETRLAMEELKVPKQFGSHYFYNIPEDLKQKYPDNILVKSHPFRAFKLAERAIGFPPEKIAAAFRALLKANRLLVSSQTDNRLILESLIVAVCSASRTAESLR
ncbi:MAG: hypothetical protein PHI85_02180 [Victivallaceae bacterium]|nr:hypothetical protein [Victivallaceae bacterium]